MIQNEEVGMGWVFEVKIDYNKDHDLHLRKKQKNWHVAGEFVSY